MITYVCLGIWGMVSLDLRLRNCGGWIWFDGVYGAGFRCAAVLCWIGLDWIVGEGEPRLGYVEGVSLFIGYEVGGDWKLYGLVGG